MTIGFDDFEDCPMAGDQKRSARQRAVEMLQREISGMRVRQTKYKIMSSEITLPLDVAEIVLACALDGMHKGQGRTGPRQSRSDELKIGSAVAWARNRKAELIRTWKNTNATGFGSAEDEAAEEARKLLFERYGLNLAMSTIRRRMQSDD